jgi:replicative DNA helicase
MAATRGQGVHFFSLEMSADEISTRWLADQAFVAETREIRSGLIASCGHPASRV